MLRVLQACIQQARCTAVILKNSTPVREVGEPTRFLIGVDGSDISHQVAARCIE